MPEDAIELSSARTEIGQAKEQSIDEIQQAIINEASHILKDPRAVTLTYPNGWAEDPSQLDYTNGSQVRFAMLKKGFSLGRDEICVAIVNNTSNQHPISLGSGISQYFNGEASAQEIAVVRFTQTASERLKKEGAFFKIGLSSNIKNWTGTFSYRGTVSPRRFKPDMPTFVESWDHGSNQLGELIAYIGPSLEHSQGQETDFKQLLVALKSYKIDTALTKKVALETNRLNSSIIQPAK